MSDKQNSDNADSAGGDDTQETSPAPTWAIWLTRIVSLGILTILIGYLFHLSTKEDIPPEFEIIPKFNEIVENDGRFALPVSIKNGATEAVTEIKIQISAGDETRTLTLPLMGQGETANMEVVFTERPSEQAFEAMVVGYQAP